MNWQTIVESLPQGLTVTDSQSVIQVWNRTMELLTGYPAAEAVGRHSNFLDLDCASLVDSAEVLAGPASAIPRLEECRIRRRDGGHVPLLKATRTLVDTGGRPVGSVLMFSDLRLLKALEGRLARLRSQVAAKPQANRLIGESAPMLEVRERIRLAAESNATILILGETGTGKEVVAEEIHERSSRGRKPLVKVNCAALPETLLESELFGHAKGAFTGAAKDKPGRFEMAHQGTLMLDEIGDLSPLTQVKLLRVLQHREFERLGENKPRHTDVRIIAATHRDLQRLVEAGRFRTDFFYRLNVFPIQLPPLRERGTDVLLLARHFMERFNRETGKTIAELSGDVRRILLDFCWPGNVRQLENAIEHAFVTCANTEIGLFDLPVEIRLTHLREQLCPKAAPAHAVPRGAAPARYRAEPPGRDELERVLAECRQNRAEAARRLGVDRTTIWRWLKTLPKADSI
ncbi:MAG: sigma 54-interacting transcriptional regulator [Verrucomicrobia bacterium]|nr:sigma 54-interacting transcriptional regulator [Verrucomicrobiota bacterium]